MSKLNEFEQNLLNLISDKFLKQVPNFSDKCYFLAELLIVEYWERNIFVTNMALHKKTTELLGVFA